MVFQIYIDNNLDYSERKIIYDIEFFMKSVEIDNVKEYFSQIKVTPIVPEIVDFLFSKEFTDGDKIWFKYHTNIMQSLKNWLFQKDGNLPLPYEKAKERHYKIFLPKIKNMIDEFVTDFPELNLNED